MTLAMIVLASLEANCKILVMVILGVIATFKGVFDSKGISDLGRLVYHITLPALLFSKILQEFSLERVHVVYWLPIFCALHSIAAFVISRVLGCLLRISRFELRVVMGSLMFGNVGALAIAVVSTLCTSEPLRSQVGPACETRAVSYIAWYLIAQNVIMFSWGEALLFAEPTEEPAAIVAAAPSRASSLGSDVKGVGSAGALAEPSVFCVERATTEEGAGSPEAAGGGALNPPPYLHSASSRAPLSPSRSLVSPSSTAGLGGLGAAVDASCSADSLGMGSAASVNTAPRMRRQRFRTAAVRARPGDDNVLIRRSSSFAYNQRSEQRRLSRSTSSLAGAGMAALLDPQQRDDEDGGTEAGYGRELGDDEMAALVPTLSYAEIQQAASRVGLEVLAFHPMHHASTSLLASTAALEPAFGSGANAEPLLQKEANQFAVIVRPGAALHGLLTVTAMRAYSVAAGVLKNPPIQAALLAVALSAYPPVKACLVGPAAPLRFASSAVESLGAAQVPISMLMLSGSGTINYMKKLKNRLEAAGADLPPFSFSVRAELAMIVGRLVVLPIAGYALYALLGPSYLGLLPTDDPLLLLVILIESAVPSAQNLIMMLLVHGDIVEGEAMASVLLRQYAVSMLTFTLAAAAFQTLIFGL